MFEKITRQWGRLDILVHSIAFAPQKDLQGGLIDCSAEGFAKAMDISCHSFIRMAKLAAPLMTAGGAIFAMSYHGANEVAQIHVMGRVRRRRWKHRAATWRTKWDRKAYTSTLFLRAHSETGPLPGLKISI